MSDALRLPGRISLVRLEQEHAGGLRDLIAATWEDTYVHTGMMPQGEVDRSVLPLDRANERIQRQIEAQYDPDDVRLNYYLGAFAAGDRLVGAIKVARPFNDLDRQSGKEGLLQKAKRKLFRVEPELLNPATAELFEVDVLPGFQRQGIGTALVNQALADLHPAITYLQLYIHGSVREFFKRFGFRNTGETAGFPDRKAGPVRVQHMLGQRAFLHSVD